MKNQNDIWQRQSKEKEFIDLCWTGRTILGKKEKDMDDTLDHRPQYIAEC